MSKKILFCKFSTKGLFPYLFLLLVTVLVVSGGWFFRGQLSSANWYRPIVLLLGAFLGILVFDIGDIPLKQVWLQVAFLAFSFWLIISTNFNFSWGLVLGINLRLWKDNFANTYSWMFTLGLVLLVVAMIL